MHTLLTFVDADDPFAPGLVGEEEWLGPTLALLAARPFDRVVLLAAPPDEKAAARTARAIRRRFPDLAVERVEVQPGEAAGLPQLVGRLAREVARWIRARDGAVTASVGAGPAIARAAWMVVASGDHARLALVDVEPRRYATGAAPRVTDLQAAGAGADQRIAHDPPATYHVEAPVAEQPARSRVGGGAAPDLDAVLRRLGVCGEDAAFRKAIATAAAVAPHKVPILVQGETGTGKGLLARLIHELSGRGAGAFVAVNCAALPENLVESTLFGHRKGAFTGAATDQPGKFELAEGGTIFLDEIGELPLTLQPKLLKVLEDGIVEPLGAARGRKADVRVVAATNRDLKKGVAAQEFREDLYYRLSYARIELPPLRERRGDIHHLALHILKDLNASLRAPRRLAPSALRRLESHDWPGNVRDLDNAIGRSVLLSAKDVIEAEDLLIDAAVVTGDPLACLPSPHEGFSLDAFLVQARRQLILRALELANGNQSSAARLLGLTPQAVHKFLREPREP